MNKLLLISLLACSIVHASEKEHPVITAARSGDLTALKAALEMEGATIDLRRDESSAKPNERKEWTALFYAAREGHKDMVEYLLQNGASVTVTDTNTKQTPLFYARTPQIAELLIKYGADINFKGGRANYTPILHIVALIDMIDKDFQKRQIEVLKFLLKQKNIDLTAKDDRGRTALEIAQKRQNQEPYKLLLAAQKEQKQEGEEKQSGAPGGPAFENVKEIKEKKEDKFEINQNQEPVKGLSQLSAYELIKQAQFSRSESEAIFANNKAIKNNNLGDVAYQPLHKNFATQAAKQDNWTFNRENTFMRGEIVLVPRSNKTYTYGIILFKWPKTSDYYQEMYLVQLDDIPTTKNLKKEDLGKFIK